MLKDNPGLELTLREVVVIAVLSNSEEVKEMYVIK